MKIPRTQKSIKILRKVFRVGDRVEVRYPSGECQPYKGTIRAIEKFAPLLGDNGLPAMNVDGMILRWKMFFFMRRVKRRRNM